MSVVMATAVTTDFPTSPPVQSPPVPSRDHNPSAAETTAPVSGEAANPGPGERATGQVGPRATTVPMVPTAKYDLCLLFLRQYRWCESGVEYGHDPEVVRELAG